MYGLFEHAMLVHVSLSKILYFVLCSTKFKREGYGLCEPYDKCSTLNNLSFIV